MLAAQLFQVVSQRIGTCTTNFIMHRSKFLIILVLSISSSINCFDSARFANSQVTADIMRNATFSNDKDLRAEQFAKQLLYVVIQYSVGNRVRGKYKRKVLTMRKFIFWCFQENDFEIRWQCCGFASRKAWMGKQI